VKVVLDTNVFVSGIFWTGYSNQILWKWRKGKFILISSLEIILELINTLKDFKIKMDDNLIKKWIDLIVANSEIIKIMNNLNIIKEDASDNKFIETALLGEADFIVTQDNDLLRLKKYKNIKILKPKEFLELI